MRSVSSDYDRLHWVVREFAFTGYDGILNWARNIGGDLFLTRSLHRSYGWL